MKGNNGKGNVIERDEWETPEELFRKLHSQYNFYFDCCATRENTKTEFYAKDFLNVNKKDFYNEMCWINPPFSKAKEILEHFFKVVDVGVGIYRADNFETKIWQNIIFKNADWVFIPKGRVNYEGMKGSGCRFPSALFGINCEPPKNVDGQILFVKNKNVDIKVIPQVGE